MKYLINGFNKYSINVFDITCFLNEINTKKIKIYDLKKKSKYNYHFLSSIKNHKKILELFPNIQVVSKKGFLVTFLSLFKYKTTILAMIISVLFYYSLSNKIWKINIVGDNELLNDFINEKLYEHNIYIGCKKLDIDSISNVQKEILFENFDTIEYLSIESKGSSINVSFKEKRKENDKTILKKSLYAKKDGVIKSFDILSGEKVVEVNDYVKKGDLLVKDSVLTDYNENIYIGTYGSVYAYTWYYFTLESKINSSTDEVELFANTMMFAKNQISKDFKDNEYIYEENVLQFKLKDKNMYIKIHFTCVEDIAKE